MGRKITQETANLMRDMAIYAYTNALYRFGFSPDELLAIKSRIVNLAKEDFIKFCKFEGINEIELEDD